MQFSFSFFHFKIYSGATITTTMSEMVASSGSAHTSGLNKRKRRSSHDEIDIENQRPPVKKLCSPSADELDSASDIENGSVEFDVLYSLGSSPKSVNLLQKIDGVNSIRNNSASRSKSTTNTNGTNNNNNSNKNIKQSNVNNNNNSNNNNNDNQHKDSNGTNQNNNNNNNIINGQAATLTPINNNNGTIHVTEMTPQSLRKTDPWMNNKCVKCSSTVESRNCPLPILSWANAKDVWRFMCDKDKKSSLDRHSKMLHKHQGLQPRMRAILLDWLNEVCEVYKLHRETYYLALDYLDRYLSTKVNVSKSYLQLIGITCLFIAAKVEEIYPPKLNEFAYVTDGACAEEDILKQELVILSALKWQTSPITIIGWLGIYMQLNVSRRTPKNIDNAPLKQQAMEQTTIQSSEQQTSSNGIKSSAAVIPNVVDDTFVFPQFSGLEYAQTAQLIDLCTLDVAIANFSYSVVAAAAISHTFNK